MQNVKKEDIKNSGGSNTVTFCHLVDICLKLQQKVNNTCDRGFIIKAKMTKAKEIPLPLCKIQN